MQKIRKGGASVADACLKAQWDMYYAEYIQNNKNKGLDLFELTNGAILYCMDKLGLGIPV